MSRRRKDGLVDTFSDCRIDSFDETCNEWQKIGLVSLVVTVKWKLRNRILMSHSGRKVVFGRCSVKKVFLKVLQNSQESTCARVSLLIKKRTALMK